MQMLPLAACNIQRLTVSDICLYIPKALASGRWWPQPLSKSNTIRACCASLLVKLVERLGPVNAIGSVEFPRFVTSLLLFARDANVTVRQTGKYGIRLLSQSNSDII
ncbi:hypothetical protein WUBG_05290 [Wuchereria bancrofti]|uniref:Uncharacterized protein n=1 Tax=Wuchereria bancrofti TaxID=6293 RepID=J9B9M6_WUCBA|nr:hypothetical protein WUBG_05290 [Wuchereria bancrofti]